MVTISISKNKIALRADVLPNLVFTIKFENFPRFARCLPKPYVYSIFKARGRETSRDGETVNNCSCPNLYRPN